MPVRPLRNKSQQINFHFKCARRAQSITNDPATDSVPCMHRNTGDVKRIEDWKSTYDGVMDELKSNKRSLRDACGVEGYDENRLKVDEIAKSRVSTVVLKAILSDKEKRVNAMTVAELRAASIAFEPNKKAEIEALRKFVAKDKPKLRTRVISLLESSEKSTFPIIELGSVATWSRYISSGSGCSLHAY